MASQFPPLLFKSIRISKSKGSVLASGAVFRALAENFERTKKCQAVRVSITRNCRDARAHSTTPRAGVLPSFGIRERESSVGLGLLPFNQPNGLPQQDAVNRPIKPISLPTGIGGQADRPDGIILNRRPAVREFLSGFFEISQLGARHGANKPDARVAAENALIGFQGLPAPIGCRNVIPASIRHQRHGESMPCGAVAAERNFAVVE
jgi:hypothetical protein